MFKPSERRFEYNINPQGEEERGGKYAPPAHYSPAPPSYSNTPAHKRASVNYSLHEGGQDLSYQPLRNDDRYEPRGRITSETVLKRTADRSAHVPRPKPAEEPPFKHTKKVYFGNEDPFRDYDSNAHRDRSRPFREDNRRADDYAHALQENANSANLQPPLKPRKPEKQDLSDYGVSEKEIMEKIGRINRLNEEINNRLQRMLNKIDGA